jgi:hypothetical protein
MIRAGDMGAVGRLMLRLSAEIKALIKSALEISYFSRGAWQYEAVLAMSAGERDLAVELINDRLKAAAKMQYPVF